MISGKAAPPGGDVRSAADRFLDHVQVIFALAQREVQSRFGQHLFGYAWTYVTPLLWIGGTYLFFQFFGRKSPVYTDLITFIISGLIPYLGFRTVISAITRVNASVNGLMIFPSVTREHGVAASALVEFINVFIVFTLVMLLNLILFGNGELDNPLQFVAGVTLAWGLGAAYGYLLSVIGRFDRSYMDFGVIVLRPMFFFSGIWYTANELPESFLSILIYNPLLHAIEIARGGMLFHYETRVASAPYAVLWIAILLLAALAVRHVARR